MAIKVITKALSRRDNKYLNVAIQAAQASTMKQRHGAVLVKGGRVLSVGINKMRNNPNHVHEYGKASVHAEADAISRVINPRGAILYIARVNRGGIPRLSRPCDNCYKLIKSSGIAKIIYTE